MLKAGTTMRLDEVAQGFMQLKTSEDGDCKHIYDDIKCLMNTLSMGLCP